MFIESLNELKKVQVLTACAMFGALAFILRSFSIDLGPYIRIGFANIPNLLVSVLFGPVTGTVFAGLMDVLNYVLHPTGPFFFGFTFNAMLAGFIYGCLFYKKQLTVSRVLIAKGIVMLICNVLLNTLWLDMLYGKGFMAILPARALKNLIMWPIDTFVFMTLTGLLEKTGIFRPFRTNIVKLKRA